MNIELKNVFTNLGRVYASVCDDKNIDITGALADPVAVIDLVLAQEKMRQIAERRAEMAEWAADCRDDALLMNQQHRGAKL
jgi:hypothetical protein